MGLMDFLASSVQAAVDSVKEGDITDIMDSGIFVNKIKRDQKMAAQQAESRKKPGKLCNSQCTVNDMRCEACLKQQQEILDGLEGLNTLEITINRSKEQSVEIPNACSLCGAPIEKGVKECPYCGTAYQIEALIANLPKTDLERDKMLLDATTKVFALYTKLLKKQVDRNKESMNLPGIVNGFANIVTANIEKGMTMDAAMIRQGANDNGVSYPTYIAGVMTGQYQSVAMINIQNQLQQQLQQQRERINESRRQQQEYYERNRQIEMERQQRLRKINAENAQRQAQMAASRVPKYSGGPGPSTGSCCGNCRYYMVYDNKCANNKFRHPSGANDYCGDYRST